MLKEKSLEWLLLPFFSVTSKFVCTPSSYKATRIKREKPIKINHILARFATILPSARQIFPWKKKSKITANTVHESSFTATFFRKRCQDFTTLKKCCSKYLKNVFCMFSGRVVSGLLWLFLRYLISGNAHKEKNVVSLQPHLSPEVTEI